MSLVDFDLKKVEHNIPLIHTINNTHNIEEIPEIPSLEEKVLVKQSYDNILSKDEKKALNDVLKEEQSFKDQISFLKKKKEKERRNQEYYP
jgi:MinD-like ATPase involved in chromosome partitioning or flagellar assembly